MKLYTHPQYLNSIMKRNVDSKLVLYHEISIGERSPIIVIFTDNQSRCYRMWKNIFKFGVPLRISMKFNLIPLPDDYQPAQYDQLVSELNNFIDYYLPENAQTWGVFNLGTRRTPKLNLVLADRRIRKTEIAFEVRPNIPEAVVQNSDVFAGMKRAGSEGSSDDDSNLGSTLIFDLKICKAVGRGRPMGSAEYVRSMEQLRGEISSSIEEPTADEVDESAMKIAET